MDYNINMRQVDKSDAMISSVECARRTMKWYKKMFFHLLDMTILNSHILYTLKTGENQTLEEFVIEVVRSVLAHNTVQRVTQTPSQTIAGPSRDTPARLGVSHFISTIPATGTQRCPQRRCHVCQQTTRHAKKRKDTRYQCSDCNVGLCLEPCFKEYHTLIHY
ncbi:PiggyBac transposable element-derived protein 4 [Chionoecetes opilio]|uniref:PiggyBac transposable element-derived protein 4 n=1 Tax=Chionoecetes opilio TaxID=41210 RepID=A0A8J4YIU2_CHIOP|nr:PiggyBac transposable element-derived protein 4 [Chionoecetes opilio]